MNIYMWIGLAIAIIGALYPLISWKDLTKHKRFITIRDIFLVTTGIVWLFIFNLPPLFVFIILMIVAVLVNKKTYTKKRLLIYGVMVGSVIAIFTFIFRENPNYVTKHLVNNPETTALYVAKDGEPIITHEENVIRPLASVVKIVVALEYAHQVMEDTIDPATEVPLSDLDVYYVEGTDGGAHPDWLRDQVEDETSVPLKEVAAGMITYSSNANTDYLIDLLGADAIHQRLEEFEIPSHDPVHPIVSPLLLVLDEKRNSSSKQWMEELEQMDDETFLNNVYDIHEQLKDGTFDTSGVDQLSLKEQQLWSDRLPGSTARVYGELLREIVTGNFDSEVNEIMRALLQWPMEMVPENRDQFEVVGAKGGSTAFIMNQAMYIETKDGTQYEIVLLTDDLSFFQMLMVQNNIDYFILSLVQDDSFRSEVIETFNNK